MESRHLRAAPRSSCFFKDDSTVSVLRRSAAEGIGKFLLMISIVGSGLQKGSSPLSSSIAISGTLIALIFAFGGVSGGHFKPTITLVQWSGNQRRLDCTVGYVAAQILGSVAGSRGRYSTCLPAGLGSIHRPSRLWQAKGLRPSA